MARDLKAGRVKRTLCASKGPVTVTVTVIVNAEAGKKKQGFEIDLTRGVPRAFRQLNASLDWERVVEATLCPSVADNTPLSQPFLEGFVDKLPALQRLTLDCKGARLDLHALKCLVASTAMESLTVMGAQFSSGGRGDSNQPKANTLREICLSDCALSNCGEPLVIEQWLFDIAACAPLTRLWLDNVDGVSAKGIATLSSQVTDLALKLMPVPPNLLGSTCWTTICLVDCWGLEEAAIQLEPTQTLREIVLWGVMSQESAIRTLQKLEKCKSLEALTITVTDGADLSRLRLERLMRIPHLRELRLVVFGPAQNTATGADLLLNALESNSSIETVLITGCESDESALQMDSLDSRVEQLFRKRPIECLEFFSNTWNRA